MYVRACVCDYSFLYSHASASSLVLTLSHCQPSPIVTSLVTKQMLGVMWSSRNPHPYLLGCKLFHQV